jgi:Domain of unknown function (DUF6268)
MKKKACRSLSRYAGALILLFGATSGFGEESASDRWFSSIFSLTGEYLAEDTYVADADVRRGNRTVQDFTESDSILRLVLTPRTKFGVLRIGAEWERFTFDLPNGAQLPDTLQSASLVVGLDTQLSDSILLRVEAQPGFYGTTNLGYRDFNMPFIIGGSYIYSPSVQIILGVGVDVERKYPVVPGAGIRWKFARQWVLNAVAPKPRLEFEAAKSLTLYAGANIKETGFRVGDHFGDRQGHPRLNHALLTYSEVRTGLGADWKISPIFTLTAEAGYEPYRTFDFYRADVRYREDGSAPYGMLSMHGAF